MMILVFLLIAPFISLQQNPSGAVIVTWNSNKESDLAGYRVYASLTSGDYNDPIRFRDVGLDTFKLFTQLPSFFPNKTVYFVVTAYDSAGNESAFSNEVQIFLGPISNKAPMPPAILLEGGTEDTVMVASRLKLTVVQNMEFDDFTPLDFIDNYIFEVSESDSVNWIEHGIGKGLLPPLSVKNDVLYMIRVRSETGGARSVASKVKYFRVRKMTEVLEFILPLK